MQIKEHIPIILASKSQMRQAMLMQLGIPFEIMPATVNESQLRDDNQHLAIREQALLLAKAKAESVAKILPKSLVIGSDQICEINGTILSKPGDKEKATVQLTQLAGNTHSQHSAVAAYIGNECVFSHVDSAKLTMRNLSSTEIDMYLDFDEPYQSCGAYRFESKGVHLFSDVKGDADTIFGMPIMPLLSFLHAQKHIELVAG